MSTPRMIVQSPPVYKSPQDIAVGADGELLYVSDAKHQEIRVLVAATLDLLGEFGGGELSYPRGLDLTANAGTGDRLAIADGGNHRIVIFRVDGTHAILVDEIKGVPGARGVALGNTGRVFASSFDDSTLLELHDGDLLASYEIGDDPADALRSPEDLDWYRANKGRALLVADSGNDRVVLVDEQLSVVRVVGGRGYGFNQPKYLCTVEHDGETQFTLISDYHNHVVKRLNANFETVDEIGAGILDRPMGIAAHGDSIWVADAFNHRILRFA